MAATTALGTSSALAASSGPSLQLTPAACGVGFSRQPYNAVYQLYVIDPDTGDPIDIVPLGRRIHNLKYKLKLNDVGELRFTMDVEDRLVNEIIDREDVIVELYRRNEQNGPLEVEGTFFIRYYDLFEEPSGRESIIFAGVSLEHLLARRIIVPDDDPQGAAGFSTKAGFADLIMAEYVREQCVNPATNIVRGFPNLTIGAFTPTSTRVTYQRRSHQDNLLEVVQDIANTSNTDFCIKRKVGNALEFLPKAIGSDYTVTHSEAAGTGMVLMSTKRGNIVDPRLTYDRRKDATYVWIGGQGLEEDRVFIPVTSLQTKNSTFNLIESVVDSRDEDTFDQIIDTGNAEIQRLLGKKTFDWEVAFGASQTRYNIDWTLGDRITVEYREVRQDVRLREMEVNITEKGEQLTPIFEEVL